MAIDPRRRARQTSGRADRLRQSSSPHDKRARRLLGRRSRWLVCGGAPYGVPTLLRTIFAQRRCRFFLHVLHGFLHGLIDVLRVYAEFFGGFLFGAGHGVLDGALDLALTDDDEAGVAGIDEGAEFLDAGA